MDVLHSHNSWSCSIIRRPQLAHVCVFSLGNGVSGGCVCVFACVPMATYSPFGIRLAKLELGVQGACLSTSTFVQHPSVPRHAVGVRPASHARRVPLGAPPLHCPPPRRPGPASSVPWGGLGRAVRCPPSTSVSSVETKPRGAARRILLPGPRRRLPPGPHGLASSPWAGAHGASGACSQHLEPLGGHL